MKRQGPTWISGLPPILPIVNTTFGIGYEKRVVTGPPCVGLHCVPFGTDGCKNRSYSTLPRLEVFSGGPIIKEIMPMVRPTLGLIPTDTMVCKNISGSSAFPRSNGVLGPSSDSLAGRRRTVARIISAADPRGSACAVSILFRLHILM